MLNASSAHLVLKATLNGVSICLYKGNIFNVNADIIINPANENIDNAGGLAKIISDMAGDNLKKECVAWVKKNGRIAPGKVAVTKAHNLEHRYKGIIHVVGPSGSQQKTPSEAEEQQLIGTILEALIEADTNSCSSIVLPAISTGIFDYKLDYAAKNHFESFIIFAGQYKVYKPEGSLKEVKLVINQDSILDEFIKKIIEKMDIFDIFEYVGTPKEIGNGLIYSYCDKCELAHTLDWFYFSSSQACGPHICDFCIFDDSLTECPSHRASRYVGQKGNAYVLQDYFCRRCLNQFPKGTPCNCPLKS